LAVGQPGVVETGIVPGAGVVALRALPIEVIGGFILGVAGLAVREPGMLKGGAFPGIGAMAG
jgi:hypothetical protein